MSTGAENLLKHLPGISGLLFAEFDCSPGRLAMPDVACDLIWNGQDLLVVGPMSTGRTIDRVHGQLALVTLDPFEARRVLCQPLSELTDCIAPIGDVSPWLANPLKDLFGLGYGARLVAPAQRSGSGVVSMAFAAGALAGGMGPRRVARSLEVSPRHFQRQFGQAAGLSPGEFARIVRFRKAIGLARGGMSLAEASFGAGYADQPHFNRESRRLTNLSPRQVLGRLGGFDEVTADVRDDTATGGPGLAP